MGGFFISQTFKTHYTIILMYAGKKSFLLISQMNAE